MIEPDPKTTSTARRLIKPVFKVLLILLAGLLFFPALAPAQTGVSPEKSPAFQLSPDETSTFNSPLEKNQPQLFACLGRQEQYLILSNQADQGPTFQIFHHDKKQKVFYPGKTYVGQAVLAVAYDDQALVFLNNGFCHSYGQAGRMKTQPRLPEHLQPLACSVYQKKLLVLIRAESATQIPLLKNYSVESRNPTAEVFPEKHTTAAEPNDSAGQNSIKLPLVAAQSGDYFLLILHSDNQYYSLIEKSLPISTWQNTKFGCYADVIYFFGIESGLDDRSANSDSTTFQSDSNESRFGNYNSGRSGLMSCYLKNNLCSQPEPLPVDYPVEVSAVLEVNRQLKIVVAVSSEGSLSGAPEFSGATVESAAEDFARFQIGYLTGAGWEFTPPLQGETERELTADIKKIAFAADEQNIAVFIRQSDASIITGLYSENGQVIQSPNRPALLSESVTPAWMKFIFSPITNLIMMALALAIVFRHKQQAFTAPKPLPDFVFLAPMVRRFLAFLFDSLLVSFVTFGIFSGQLVKLQTKMESIEQFESFTEIPEFMQFSLIYSGIFILYMILTETLLSASPGKLSLGLIVINENNLPLTPGQAFLRNFLRLIDLHTWIFAYFLIFITARRQRVGDLFAHTIVAVRTPQLQQRMFNAMNSRKPDQAPDDDSDSSDENSGPYQDDSDFHPNDSESDK
ncbi:MAG: RDD family protein [Sedimentisphaerales bacterium]|nr:RDD family protein [Sedimentisphaerales bacterium]